MSAAEARKMLAQIYVSDTQRGTCSIDFPKDKPRGSSAGCGC